MRVTGPLTPHSHTTASRQAPARGPSSPCAPGSLGACPPGLWRSTARGQELLLTWLSPHRAPAAPQLVDGNLAWSVQIFLFCDSFWISDCLFLILSRNLDFPLQLPIPAPREEANSMEQQVKVAGTNYRMACTNNGGATLGRSDPSSDPEPGHNAERLFPIGLPLVQESQSSHLSWGPKRHR